MNDDGWTMSEKGQEWFVVALWIGLAAAVIGVISRSGEPTKPRNIEAERLDQDWSTRGYRNY